MESGLLTQTGHYFNLCLLSLGFKCKYLKAKNTFATIFEK